MQTGRSRPLGVTIVAILMIIEGIFLILGGISGIAIGGIVADELGGAIIAASSVGLALGIAGLFIAWGLISGKGWAWIITIIITIIMAIVNIISIASGRYEHLFGFNHQRRNTLLHVSTTSESIFRQDKYINLD